MLTNQEQFGVFQLSLAPRGDSGTFFLLTRSSCSDCILLSQQVEDRDYLEKVSGSISQTFVSIYEKFDSKTKRSLANFSGIPSSFCPDSWNSHILGWDVVAERKRRDGFNRRRRDFAEGN